MEKVNTNLERYDAACECIGLGLQCIAFVGMVGSIVVFIKNFVFVLLVTCRTPIAGFLVCLFVFFCHPLLVPSSLPVNVSALLRRQIRR